MRVESTDDVEECDQDMESAAPPPGSATLANKLSPLAEESAELGCELRAERSPNSIRMRYVLRRFVEPTTL